MTDDDRRELDDLRRAYRNLQKDHLVHVFRLEILLKLLVERKQILTEQEFSDLFAAATEQAEAEWLKVGPLYGSHRGPGSSGGSPH